MLTNPLPAQCIARYLAIWYKATTKIATTVLDLYS